MHQVRHGLYSTAFVCVIKSNVILYHISPKLNAEVDLRPTFTSIALAMGLSHFLHSQHCLRLQFFFPNFFISFAIFFLLRSVVGRDVMNLMKRIGIATSVDVDIFFKVKEKQPVERLTIRLHE